MNHLVTLDARSGDLEKILSGVKSMLVRDLDFENSVTTPIAPGDNIYFLRSNGEKILRVSATIVGVHKCTNSLNEDLSSFLKEMQPKLQLTEAQFRYWSGKERVQLIEFTSAQKVKVILTSPNKAIEQSEWIVFDDFEDIK